MEALPFGAHSAAQRAIFFAPQGAWKPVSGPVSHLHVFSPYAYLPEAYAASDNAHYVRLRADPAAPADVICGDGAGSGSA